MEKFLRQFETMAPLATYALALDYGQLFGGGSGSIKLSNGFVFNASGSVLSRL